jgi:hypothetical protein
MHAVIAAFVLSVLNQAGEYPTDKQDRRTILDTLRLPVEAKLGQKVEFVVTTLRKERAWVFVQAEPRRPGGKAIDGRRFFGSDWDNMDGLTTTAILRRSGRRWHIVDLRIGATDAWYCGHVPAAQFDPCDGQSEEK